MSEGNSNGPKVLHNLSKEGKTETEVDQEGTEQEEEKGENESCNRNCYVTVILFTYNMIFLCFY